VGRRDRLIRVGIGFDDFVDRLTEKGVQAARDAVEDALDDIVEDARAQWPSRSGRSATSFHVSIEEAAGRVAGEIVNDSGYAPYINGGRTLHELVVVPFQTAVRLLPAEIERRLSEIE
jgi:hypothetical protein